jgi:hypothetical protein
MSILTLLMIVLIVVILVSAVVETRPEARGWSMSMRRRLSLPGHAKMAPIDRIETRATLRRRRDGSPFEGRTDRDAGPKVV